MKQFNNTTITCASAFSGIGSFEEALKNLEINHTNEYMIEIDGYARDTYLVNHSVKKNFKDITKVNMHDILEVDILLLSPQCQSFSQQGLRKGFEDTRGTLVYDGLKLVQTSKPKVVLFENVKGYVNHDNGNTLEVTLNAFKELGYKVQYKVLNSKNYGTAQNRERLFIIAIRNDVKIDFTFPTPRPVSKSVNDYIVQGADYSDYTYDASNRKDFKTKVKTDIKKLYFLPDVKFNSDRRICSTEGIAPTIVASSAKTKFYDTKNKLFRYLTLDEMAAIQGFSKGFKFPVSNTQKKKQIGNSISVPVLEAILKELLLKNDVLPKAANNDDFTNTHTTQCASLLKTIKEKCNIVTDCLTHNIKQTRKIATDRTSNIIEENINKPFTAKNMYINQALINYSKDKNLFNDIKDMSKDQLTDYLKNKTLSIVNVDSFSDDSDTKSFVPFPYAGGKQGVNKTSMQKLLRDAFKNKRYKTWIDPFAGAFGATYNVLPILLENGVEELVINDINKSIVNTYRHIQKNPKQVQRHLASISLDYYKEYGKFKPQTREESRALHNKLELEFRELEVQRKMSPRRAALFMFLMAKSTGGMIDYDIDTKTCFFETSYKIINIDYLINKVEIYHQVFNLIKTTFKSIKYQTIFKNYKNNNQAFVLIDPPYIEYSEEVSEKSASFTYGINFNHKELLCKMKNVEFDFIYYNNHNLLIQNYASIHGYEYIKTPREFANNTEDRTTTIEISMLKFNKKEVNSDLNTIDIVNVNSAIAA